MGDFMLTFLLVVIYLAFISLGLPDSLLGSSWPVMHQDLEVSLSSAGMVSMLVTSGTIVSSLLSARVISRFGTGKVTFVSVFLTAASLLGFSLAGSFPALCLLAVPLGLGAGAVDSGLNNFIALHYEARHMSWLHCFWGVGAAAGPLILSRFLLLEGGWRKGYLVIACIQFILTFLLLFSLPLWSKAEAVSPHQKETEENKGSRNLLSFPLVRLSLLSFIAYCAIETTTGLWGTSYLVSSRGLTADLAAQLISFFYVGITAGRLITGFLSLRLSGRILIRSGLLLVLCGILCFLHPGTGACILALILIGLGCAPVFPCMLHDTPQKAGEQLSSRVMGLQMASAYLGSTLMPPLFGFLAGLSSPSLFPFFLGAALLALLWCTERTNRQLSS